MRSLLHQLENNEAVLMMYLADELPPQDRAEVEQMLSTDAALRAELVRLGEAQAAVDTAMARLDTSGPRLLNEGVAVRRVGRAIAQWHADRLAAPAQMPAAIRSGFPKWGIAVAAAAACVLISGLVWWASDLGGDAPHLSGPYVDTRPSETDQDDANDPAPKIAEVPPVADRDPYLLPVEAAAPTTQNGGVGSGGLAWADRYDQLENELSAISGDRDTATFFAEPERDSNSPDGF
jgi:hypothetical protein